jgi:hypothetical protein
MISKTKHNDQKEQEEASDEEEYQTDEQYEQDRLTDDNAYSEYIEDNENLALKHLDIQLLWSSDIFTSRYFKTF